MGDDSNPSDAYGPLTPCSQCGKAIPANAPEWTEYCNKHKDQRQAVVPVDALTELVDNWNNQGLPQHPDPIKQREMCADELQSVIDDYREGHNE